MITGLDVSAGDNLLAFNYAHGETCYVNFTGGIEVGHFRCLASEQSCVSLAAGLTYSFHQVENYLGINFADG